MVSDDRQQRTSPARAAAALSFLLLATGVIGAGADAERANAQGASLDNSYAAPEPAAPQKRATRDDAYSPPPENRTYLQPVSPAGEETGGNHAWSRPVPSQQGQTFDRNDGSAPQDGSVPQDGSGPQNAVMRDAIPPPVEKGDLAPVMSGDGSGLPYEIWGGLDVAGLEKLLTGIEIPPRSPALHNLWKRLITSPSGDGSSADFAALRLDALYRSGLAREAAAELARRPADSSPLLATRAPVPVDIWHPPTSRAACPQAAPSRCPDNPHR